VSFVYACSQLVVDCVTLGYTIEHTHAKISASALERQVSSGNTNDEIVDHYCNLTHAQK
jgi:hypothetical protein